MLAHCNNDLMCTSASTKVRAQHLTAMIGVQICVCTVHFALAPRLMERHLASARHLSRDLETLQHKWVPMLVLMSNSNR